MRGALPLAQVAQGVWRVQGNPGRCNVYFIEEGDRVVQFDAGGRMMLDDVRDAVTRLAPLRCVVLGHGHTDHRGTAPFLDTPVLCHPDEVEDATGSGGFRYWGRDLARVPQPLRFLHREILHPRFWDGGPIKVADTLQEGDEIAGFRVVHLPGHAPGQFALFREADGTALTTDVFYSIDEWGRDTDPHIPDDYWNLDTELARESLRKLSELPLRRALPGHGDPLEGDLGRILRTGLAGPGPGSTR